MSQQQENRVEDNLFDNNIFDVHSIEDIQNLKNIEILSKKGEEYYLFEFGDDFWKYDNGQLTQYADYVSMRDAKAGIDATMQDYGLAINDSIKNSKELEAIKDFSLIEREIYIKGKADSVHSIVFKGVKGDMQGISQPLQLNSKEKELQDVTKLSNAVVDVIALSFAIFKAAGSLLKKNELANKVLNNLSLDKANEYLRDPELMKEIPQLKKALQSTDDFVHNFQLTDRFKHMKPIEQVNEILNFAMSDEDVKIGADKLSETLFFKKHFVELSSKLEDLNKDLQGEFPALTDYLQKNDTNSILFLNNYAEKDFANLLKDLNVNEKNPAEIKEFLAATHFYKANSINGESLSPDYHIRMMRFFSSQKDFKSINFNNVKDIVDKIGNKILKLDIQETKEKGSAITL